MEELISKHNIPSKYAFKVCRIEPENNLHVILKAFSEIDYPIVVVGNWENSQYGIQLKNSYNKFNNLLLLDPIYNQDELDQIRSNCTIYVHGHSAGGTNPSLVEAMCLGLPTIVYDVSYNRETTFDKALYFNSSESLKELITTIKSEELIFIGDEMKKIASKEYTWDRISAQYLNLIQI